MPEKNFREMAFHIQISPQWRKEELLHDMIEAMNNETDNNIKSDMKRTILANIDLHFNCSAC